MGTIRLKIIQRYLRMLTRSEMRSIGRLAFSLLCAQPRIWRRWSYDARPLVIG